MSGKRKRRLVGIVLSLALALAVVSPASAGARVVLGSKTFAPHGNGWGTKAPAEIFNGGDPSGLVSGIHWRHWGDPVAIGYGKNSIFKPGGGYYPRLVRIELRADDIGSCNGRRAYRRLIARVPSHPGGKLGPWFLWSGAKSLCGPPARPRPARHPYVPEPQITVATPELEASFHCHGEVTATSPQPLLFVTGTGATGEEGYLIGKGAFEATGHPVCDVDFPDYTTADIQVSVQYLVYAIRKEYKLGGSRKIAIFGISQGGLLPRFALTYWPSLRAKVSDVIAAAGTQHGSNVVGPAGPCSATNPCPPAGWQQAAGSKLLVALNRQPVEAPGPTAWTTVRSLTDEAVQPQGGKHPTSALKGATNILIQSVCPGRTTTHIGTAFDSVTFAAFLDAIAHPGPAKLSRLPADVCSHPYAPGLDEATTNAFLSGSGGLIATQESSVPKVSAEPKLRPYVTRIVAG